MHRIATTLSTLALTLAAPVAMAQGLGETVTFTMQVQQPSLFDSDRRDVFQSTVDDRSGTSSFEVTCSAGASAWLGLSRIDEACSVTGSGIIKNPNNPAQTLPRINYLGGFTIEADSDGYTNVTTILANYLRAGAAGAENTSFKGNVIMMPENPSASAQALSNRLLDNLRSTATGTSAVEFSTEIDSIRFENFTVPHVGLGDTQSCSWTGDAIYAYANDAWQMEFDVKCGDDTFRLEGNMPLLDAPAGSAHNEEYALSLVLPGAGGAGGDPFAAADPFATVDGLTGVLRMSNTGRSNEDGVYESVKVEGEFTGTGLPLELVRSYAQIMSIFARTYFGA
jgi:hypothetical protein